MIVIGRFYCFSVMYYSELDLFMFIVNFNGVFVYYFFQFDFGMYYEFLNCCIVYDIVIVM